MSLAVTGVPWERRGEGVGTAAALAATLRDFLFRPLRSGAALRRGPGGSLDALLYLLLVAAATALVAVAAIATLLILSAAPLMQRSEPESTRAFLAAVWGGAAAVACALPLFIAAKAAVVAVLLHLTALMFGAARRGFGGTFAAVAYGLGSVLPLLLIPSCGSTLATIWGLIATTRALAGAHGTDVGRAGLALLALVLLSILLGIAAVLLLANLGGRS